MPNSDPQDRIVYPIQKLMIDSYNLQRPNKIVPADHWSCKNGPVNAHLTPGSGILECFIPRAGADNPYGTSLRC